MNLNAGLQALCLLALVVVSASENPTKAPKCSPIEDFAVCLPYVKGHGKWPPPAYSSPCCKLVRKESPDCLCKAATYKHKNFDVDLSKAVGLPKACGKKEDKGTKYWCAPKPKSPPYHHKSPPPPKKSHPPPHHHKSPPPPKKSHPPPHHHKSPPPREKSPPYHHHFPPPPHH